MILGILKDRTNLVKFFLVAEYFTFLKHFIREVYGEVGTVSLESINPNRALFDRFGTILYCLLHQNQFSNPFLHLLIWEQNTCQHLETKPLGTPILFKSIKFLRHVEFPVEIIDPLRPKIENLFFQTL